VSQNKEPETALFARFILPISGPVIENGVVVIAGTQIVFVGTRQDFEKCLETKGNSNALNRYELGEAIITPGFINLHTHLDYTALSHFDNQSGFFDWIGGLVKLAWRWNQDQWLESALMGARAVALAGTTCIVDSSFSGQAAFAAAQYQLRAIVGLELFGLRSDQVNDYWKLWLDKWEAFFARAQEAQSQRLIGGRLLKAIEEGTITISIAPHAPYTVCPQLWRKAVDWASSKNLPLLVHLSESSNECAWIADKDSRTDKFLAELVPQEQENGQFNLEWKGLGLSPCQHLNHWGLLTENTIAAHVVHLSDEDIKLLADAKIGIAHCPRSNSRLRNGVARLDAILKAGINAGFGTDSAASTDNLDQIQEALFGYNLHRAVNPSFSRTSQDAVHMLTLGAAKVIRQDSLIGSLEEGKLADIAVFQLPAELETQRQLGNNPNSYDILLYGSCKLSELFVNGAHIVSKSKLTQENHQLATL
jgi:5-methylthioadenosine/S-adenosylhomocysteine deaminase